MSLKQPAKHKASSRHKAKCFNYFTTWILRTYRLKITSTLLGTVFRQCTWPTTSPTMSSVSRELVQHSAINRPLAEGMWWSNKSPETRHLNNSPIYKQTSDIIKQLLSKSCVNEQNLSTELQSLLRAMDLVSCSTIYVQANNNDKTWARLQQLKSNNSISILSYSTVLIL